ncbi:hypothetical protein [Scopulibacillus cellulosilyticus]|uniref:AraC family transcriptional regulator n=1 Tax=Scopulibacillus cellulosilyticus TaxID=2665665 RepID=A0ABW2PY60_9BACL
MNELSILLTKACFLSTVTDITKDVRLYRHSFLLING